MLTPKQCQELTALRSLQDILLLRRQTPIISLSGLVKTEGEKKTLATLTLYFITLSLQLKGLKNNLNQHDMEQLATLFLQEFGGFSLLDVHLLCRRIFTGYYGNLYESLHPHKVFCFAREYIVEMNQTATQLPFHHDKPALLNQYLQATTTKDLEIIPCNKW